jgi:hypothetical protein
VLSISKEYRDAKISSIISGGVKQNNHLTSPPPYGIYNDTIEAASNTYNVSLKLKNIKSINLVVVQADLQTHCNYIKIQSNLRRLMTVISIINITMLPVFCRAIHKLQIR